jgi:DNA-binding Lrp family transcriptional regulator
MQEQILAALKKLGPTSPGALEDHLGASHAGLGRHLKEMLDAGTIKAAGVTKSRRLALPDQDFGDKPAPPQRRKPKQHAKRGQRKAAKKAPARPRAPYAPQPAAERFIPAVDAASRLIIVNGAEPLIFTDTQTEAIASLLFQHYKD